MTEPGTQCVHADVIRPELASQRAGEVDLRRLGRSVVPAGPGVHSGDRADEQHHAAAGADHPRLRRSGRYRRVGDVQIEREAPVLRLQGLEPWATGQPARAGDEEIQPAKGFGRSVDECCECRSVGHVQRAPIGRRAASSQLLERTFHLGGGARANRDGAALIGKAERDRAADTPGASGDEGSAPRETEVHV